MNIFNKLKDDALAFARATLLVFIKIMEYLQWVNPRDKIDSFEDILYIWRLVQGSTSIKIDSWVNPREHINQKSYLVQNQLHRSSTDEKMPGDWEGASPNDRQIPPAMGRFWALASDDSDEDEGSTAAPDRSFGHWCATPVSEELISLCEIGRAHV